jgi:hypothetical protein
MSRSETVTKLMHGGVLRRRKVENLWASLVLKKINPLITALTNERTAHSIWYGRSPHGGAICGTRKTSERSANKNSNSIAKIIHCTNFNHVTNFGTRRVVFIRIVRPLDAVG